LELVAIYKESKPARGTHSLEREEVRTGYSGKKVSQQEALTTWREKRSGLVTTWKESNLAKDTYFLERAEGRTG